MSIQEMPKECLDAFKEVSEIGVKQGHRPGSWRQEHPFSHILKGIGHLMDFMLGREEEKHLYHGMWRICAAVAVVKKLRSYNVVETAPNEVSIRSY
jgi:hypothetical protein